MTDDSEQSDGTTDARERSWLASNVSTANYKVRGRLTDLAGIGVLGNNRADSGDPVGVYGQVSNGYSGNGRPVGVYGTVPTTDGYGVLTPDDAKIEGDLDATSGHTLTIDGDPVLRTKPPGSDADGDTGGGGVVGGLKDNTVHDAVGATISGGGGRRFAGADTRRNEVTDDYGTVGGGEGNTAGDGESDTQNATHATVAGGAFNNATGEYSTIGGGEINAASGAHTTIAGGEANTADGNNSTVGGGFSNDALNLRATVAGGSSNVAELNDTVGGGLGNEARGTESTVAGGRENLAYSKGTVVGGGRRNQAATTGSFKGQYGTVGGGRKNEVFGDYGTIAGGGPSNASGNPTGTNNVVTDKFGTIGGGGDNQAGNGTSGLTDAAYATVGGGRANDAKGDHSTVGGGNGHEAHGSYSTIVGGRDNRTGATGSSLGTHATVLGGRDNIAKGDLSLCAGRGAKSEHKGCFVWADSTNTTFPTGQADQFLIVATGGTGIGTNDTPHNRLTVQGNNPSTTGNYGNHVAGIQSDTSGGDVLALRNSSQRDPGAGTNYVTFFDDRTTTSIGAIQGSGGGIDYATGNKDLAEYFPKADPEVEFEPGDVVGLSGGEAVADPTTGEAALVVSGAPMVTGNLPDDDESDEYVRLALTGQVPVQVRESVAAGEVLVADDGPRAVPRRSSDQEDPAVVGLTLAASEDGTVRTLVGGHAVEAAVPDSTEGSHQRDASRSSGADPVDDRKRRLRELETDVAELRDEVQRKDDRIADLEAENETIREELASLRASVDALSGSGAESPADD